MQYFRLKLATKEIVLGFLTLIIIGLASLIITHTASSATTYSYASGGSKISINYGGENWSLSKQSISSQPDKDEYRGVVRVVQVGNTKCMLGIIITVTPGASSGEVSAPAFANGIPSVGNGGDIDLSCPRDLAARLSDFNKTISITGSDSDETEAPESPELDSQKVLIVKVYSPEKDPPTTTIDRSYIARAGGDSKQVSWNGSTGTATWRGVEAGLQMRICITPAGIFDTQDCKTVTKTKRTPLVVTFGSFENSYNEDGKLVDVTVNFKVVNAPSETTYGPIALTIITEAGEAKGGSSTSSNTYGKDGVTPEQKAELKGSFDNIDPGKYKVCIDGLPNVCSSVFEKKANMSSSVVIDVSDEDSKKLLVGGTEEGASGCQVEGLGWILCPVINAMAGMTDALFGIVGAMMEVTALGFDTNNALFKAWAIMRTVANVAFIIAFLIIIFSQLTGAGITNYGVKKMLPRLVIAAILVNISYFLCALAVDLSNVLGWSVQQVLTNMADTVSGTSSSTGAATTSGETWGSLARGILSLGAIGGGIFVGTSFLTGIGIWGALAGLLPLLVSALFAILIAFVVLLARQAFIIMLIVISPLAFVAFLLPNTESLFKKWRSFFVTLLALFPMMALVYGGSVLASSIMRVGAETQLASPQANIIGFFLYLGSVAVLAIPFFITPILIKLSSGVLNRFAGMVNNPNKGPIDKMRKGAERLSNNIRQAEQIRKLGKGGKMNFGARHRVRKGLKDQTLKTGLEAAEASQTISDPTSAKLANQSAYNSLASSAINSARSGKITSVQANGDNADIVGALGAAATDPDVEKALAAQTAKAVSEAIKDAKISANIDPGDIKAMADNFREAVAGGDSIKARAMQDMMLGSGAKGIKAWDKEVQGVEAGGSMSAEMRRSLQQRVLDENPGIKASDAAVMTWATNTKGHGIAGIRADAETWGMSNDEFAGMKAHAQHDAIRTGVINPVRAQEIMSSQAFSRIDEGVKSEIRRLSTSPAPWAPTGATPTTTAGSTGTPAPDPTLLNVHKNGP